MGIMVPAVVVTLAAFPLVRCTFRFQRGTRLVLLLPMIIPHFLMGVALLLFIVELVRRRKLKEEYSVLWVSTSLVKAMLFELRRKAAPMMTPTARSITFPR